MKSRREFIKDMAAVVGIEALASRVNASPSQAPRAEIKAKTEAERIIEQATTPELRSKTEFLRQIFTKEVTQKGRILILKLRQLNEQEDLFKQIYRKAELSQNTRRANEPKTEAEKLKQFLEVYPFIEQTIILLDGLDVSIRTINNFATYTAQQKSMNNGGKISLYDPDGKRSSNPQDNLRKYYEALGKQHDEFTKNEIKIIETIEFLKKEA